MTPRARVLAVVAAAAAVAVAGRRRGDAGSRRAARARPRPGAVDQAARRTPPLLFDFGDADDPEARDLSNAATLLRQGQARAGGGDLRALPLAAGADRRGLRGAGRTDGLDTVKRLVAANPQSPAAQLHLGSRSTGRAATPTRSRRSSRWTAASRLARRPSTPRTSSTQIASCPGLPYMVAAREPAVGADARCAAAEGEVVAARLRRDALAPRPARLCTACLRRRRRAGAERPARPDARRRLLLHEDRIRPPRSHGSGR